MKTLLIVYHTQSGASAALARAVREGACAEAGVEPAAEPGVEPEMEPGLNVRLLRAWDCGARDLLAATGVVLLAAETSGSVSGGMKDFLDRVFYPLHAAGKVLPYALVISAGNDGRGARAQVQRIVSGIPLREIMPPLICRGEVTESQREQCREIGIAFAAGLTMGIF